MTRSIMQKDRSRCFICGSRSWIEEHHVFGGPDRKRSTKYGLVVSLCHYCHNEPPNGVHHNAEKMAELKACGQATFEDKYGHDLFMAEFGKNWRD